MASTLVRVLDGEKVAKILRVDGNKVYRKHVTEHRKLGRVVLEWTFDFEGVTQEELMVLASRSVLIGSRPTFKETSIEEAEKWKVHTIFVREYLESNREKVAPEEKVRRAMDKLTPAARKALLDELLAKQ